MNISPTQKQTDIQFYLSLADRQLLSNFLLAKLIVQQYCKESVKDIYLEFKLFIAQNNLKTHLKKSQFRFALIQLLQEQDSFKSSITIIEEKAGFVVQGVGLMSVQFEESLSMLQNSPL